ncbi:MAG: PfkB family carbohydrate kinase [Actinobacteria bacterium]|nr:fructoselysine 6-kinase [Actinomycetota bacterium]MCA0307780.1 PfkB family carbohydrate kinase [Actinomycetota bacterium]
MKVVAIGDNCLDWYLDRQMVHPGGNALNVAVYTHRLGAESSYIGQFGTDWAGDVMIAALEAEGVDISRIRRAVGTSGYATIETIRGDRVFRGSSNGVVAFTPTPEDYAFMAGADVIHTGDSSFLDEHVAELAAIAPVSFDFSIKPRDYCERLLPQVTYATFSRPGLSPDEVNDLIGWARDLGASEVFVTQGEAGSYSWADGRLHYEPASAASQIVDTLGAGDSFIAGMLVARLAGAPLDAAAARASALAAQSCGTLGAFGYAEPAARMTVASDHRFAS